MPEQFYDTATYAARDSVGYLVRRLYTIMQARIEAAFADRDLTLMQWAVLMHLRDGLVRTASDIAREFHHDSGALTRIIDQLERRRLLRRKRSSLDRRVVELELTAAGRDLIAELLPRVVREMNFALQPLDRAEFESFREQLGRVLQHLHASTVSTAGASPRADDRPAPRQRTRRGPAATPAVRSRR